MSDAPERLARQSEPGRLFVFGLGYSAHRLAMALAAAGWDVSGTTRDAERAAELRSDGFDAHVLDGSEAASGLFEALGEATHVLVSTPPRDDGDPVLAHHERALDTVLAGASGPRWLGYLSTTGVYGDRDGGTVDENSDLLPTGERGQRRVEAEGRWAALGERHDMAVRLFRLPGIYGPGRSALDTVRSGRARRIDKPGQVFSRIHVDDIAQAVIASIVRDARIGEGVADIRAYNVTDDEASPPGDVIAFACRLLGREPPAPVPFDEAELSDMVRSFYRDNKRVANRRLREELGVDLAYPDYRAGLSAILREGD